MDELVKSKRQGQRTVLHLLYSGLGGHGSVFFSLVKADQDKKFITSAVFCGIEDVRKDYTRQCDLYDIPYKAIKKTPGIDLRTIRKIVQAFSAARPDTIFLHGATFILPTLWYKFFHPRTKIIVRDTQAHHLKSKREWFSLKLAIRHADKLVFLTEESLKSLEDKFQGKDLQQKAVIISNGLDTALYSPRQARDISRNVVIGMQSRLQPIKDHPALLRAFADLQKQLPDHNLSLRIAGDGETMGNLRTLATELQIENQVEFTGMLNEDELLKFMHSLDIYVHATLGETMSNSIMQALSCGLPTVVSDVWGVNNMVRQSENGLLYNSGDSDDLARHLKELIINDALRNRLEQAGRTYAEREYSLETLFNKYAVLF